LAILFASLACFHVNPWGKALALEKIWSVANSDYELKKKRDAFLDFLELARKEELKAIFEWRKYLKQETDSVTSKKEA
jgi:hypothetical protein